MSTVSKFSPNTSVTLEKSNSSSEQCFPLPLLLPFDIPSHPPLPYVSPNRSNPARVPRRISSTSRASYSLHTENDNVKANNTFPYHRLNSWRGWSVLQPLRIPVWVSNDSTYEKSMEVTSSLRKVSFVALPPEFWLRICDVPGPTIFLYKRC